MCEDREVSTWLRGVCFKRSVIEIVKGFLKCNLASIKMICIYSPLHNHRPNKIYHIVTRKDISLTIKMIRLCNNHRKMVQFIFNKASLKAPSCSTFGILMNLLYFWNINDKKK